MRQIGDRAVYIEEVRRLETIVIKPKKSQTVRPVAMGHLSNLNVVTKTSYIQSRIGPA
jgi:hypothetical protein